MSKLLDNGTCDLWFRSLDNSCINSLLKLKIFLSKPTSRFSVVICPKHWCETVINLLLYNTCFLQNLWFLRWFDEIFKRCRRMEYNLYSNTIQIIHKNNNSQVNDSILFGIPDSITYLGLFFSSTWSNIIYGHSLRTSWHKLTIMFYEALSCVSFKI